jgi:PAS domain S-box-containing protein
MKREFLSSKEVILPFVVPTIVEVLLIAFILITILGARTTENELEKNITATAMVGDVFHDVTVSSVRVLTQDNVQLAKILPVIKEKLRSANEDLTESREIKALNVKSAAELSAVITDFSECIETLAGSIKDGNQPETAVMMGKVALILDKAKPPSNDLFTRLKERKHNLLKQRDTLWSGMIALLVVALLTPVFAAAYSFIFAGRLANRMNSLRESVVTISRGERVEQNIPGSDEFSELHRAILDLSVVMDRARQKERAMIDNAAEIICSLDESLKLSEVNPAVEAKLGYDQQELIGMNIQSLVHPDDREETYEQLGSVKSRNSGHTFEVRLRHRDGQYIFTDWSTNWSNDDKSILCVIHDITDRKKAEQLKQDVIAMVSHDLRAPLTSIAMVLDMVMEGAAGELNERGDRLVSRAQLSVASLISMIKDLLDIERYEAGGLTLNLEQSNSKELVTRAIDMVKPEAERKSLMMDISCDDTLIVCDPERVNRILVNLINNAIKFSKDGKIIYITGKVLKHRNQPAEVEFQIIDEGPGIPESKIDSIFDKFTQVGTGSAGERSGSGLGLAICKALVEAHRGTIGVTSVLGEGTTFWFRLPQGVDSVRNSGAPRV